MIYTSGTTTRPKGVVHAHRTALGRVPMHHDWQGLTADDVMLHAGAFNWSYTLGVGLLDPWACGATAVLYNGPKDIEVWPKLIDAVGATLFAAVPSLYRQMLKYCDLAPGGLTTLRHGLAAGEALSPAIIESWRAATGKEIYEAFGMSECSTFISNRAGMPIRPGSPGKPQHGRRIAVIPVRGPNEPVACGRSRPARHPSRGPRPDARLLAATGRGRGRLFAATGSPAATSPPSMTMAMSGITAAPTT